jgi:hypothetical protein
LLLLASGALFLLPRDRITQASWEKIRTGMTEKEVEEVLGGPGMDQETFQDHCDTLEKQLGKRPFITIDGICLMEPVSGPMLVPNKSKIWLGRRGAIEIQFDNDGKVFFRGFRGIRPADPTFLESVRDWLGW